MDVMRALHHRETAREGVGIVAGDGHGTSRRMAAVRIQRLIAGTALALVSALSACATEGATPSAEPSASPSPSSVPTPAPPTQTGTIMQDSGTPITLTIGGQVVTATLFDNPAADELAARLPVTMTFDDFHGVEKISTLDSPLSMAGMPAGADPEIGDIGFWAPGGDLVLYYGEVGYFDGIARLGTFDGVDVVRAQSGPFTVTIAAA